ncbi:lytic murein transglycosylase B [Candidatus Thiothrix sp. Deng01]|uniref:Lytic murein transglycosylase B n=1 Tax=Candidatus Thiothrix phosphatis TaxID=3112415 RepID=A0ABU6CZZ3_9GAMM|nr:lytic murein transglycosylase B [Candidatus Thiothrix sp. Deng01]MEB4592146.1 lytic murein transglycosylase B [Candidatus Thiothrix sp. Deng01]
MGIMQDSPIGKKTLGQLAVLTVLGSLLGGCGTPPGSASPQWPWVFSPPSSAPPGQTAPPPTAGVPPRGNTVPPATTTPRQPNNNYAQGLRGDYASYPALRQFIGKMNSQHGFDVAFLEQTFSGVQRDSEALTKVGAPAEGQGWRAYRPIFLTEERIRGGVDFWNRNQALLDAATRQYGVDPEYLVAIIGVETQYGKNTGAHNVLSALTTLGFDYPRRASFYQKELEQFLLLSREERVRPQIFKGSYAGAMGLGQFISSSYRSYAIDGNRDGKRDMWNPQDAIPSVANYFAKNGWKRGGGVAVPAYVSGGGYASIAETTAKKPSRTLGQLLASGVRPQGALNSSKVSLIKLEGSTDEYWVGGENFYVITRYNPNVKYAMAVHQLAQAIRQRKFGL